MTRREKFAALALWGLIVLFFTVAMACDVPRDQVYRPSPQPRSTPRVVPPRGFHTRLTSGNWIVLEPNE